MTVLYGLIGKPLGHSLSSKYFNAKFEAQKTDAHYDLFPLENINELPQLIEAHPNLAGLNVTIPYKQEVISYLDEIDFAAKMIGAVNTISVRRVAGKVILKGFNTDAFGFEETLKTTITQRPPGMKALVLGTGGAARAVRYILRKCGVPFRSVGRTYLKSDQLIYGLVTPSIIQEYKLIINTTPAGMYPDLDDAPEIPYDYITQDHILVDVIYNPEITKFLQYGLDKGAIIANGKKMFILQAEAAWKIWQKNLD
mgnify:CR=1 FL=1